MATRREQILTVAAQLFARRGYHGVSIADLGAAVGISGPALYRHFPGKEALLEEMLVGISEHLLAGGREIVASTPDPDAALVELIAFHARFATREPELIVVQDRDLANLSPAARAKVRKLQGTYVDLWIGVLHRARPAFSEMELKLGTHATFGLLNSTPHGGRGRGTAEVLERMALAALTDSPE